jgi:hypothetical protein
MIAALLLLCSASPALARPPSDGDMASPGDTELAPEHEYPTDHREPRPAPCALGHLCLGPVLTLGLPNLVGIGVHARISPYVGAGFDYQYLPTFGIESVPVNASAITLEGRVYPLGDAFFIAGGFAYQSVTAEGRRAAVSPEDGREVILSGSGELGLPLLKLGVGWLGDRGPVLGIDLAIEIPLGSRKLDIRTRGNEGSEVFDEEVTLLREEIQEQADNVLDFIPLVIQLNFLRLGYIF